MSWEKPTSADFWKGVEVYLDAAYAGQEPPALRARLDALRLLPEEVLYQSPAFEPAPKEQPVRLALRMGNPWYPHMKMMIEQSPDRRGSLFRVDTHDRHIQVDAATREYRVFCELMRKNQALAGEIEAAWEAQGLATFKSFLREDLARRRGF